jgi:hypothetical protein
MSAPLPVVRQLRDALSERTRLENDFKTKILNRINAILQQLQDCDQALLPPTAAGVLNIAIADLDAIVRDIRNPTNMTDRDVEQIVEPLESRRRNNTMRLLPAGRPVDGARPLSNPAPASSLTGSRFWPFGRSPASPAPASAPSRGSSIYRNGPDSLFDNLDDLDDERRSDSFNGVTGLARSPVNSRLGYPGFGGKRTRRKYHRKA